MRLRWVRRRSGDGTGRLRLPRSISSGTYRTGKFCTAGQTISAGSFAIGGAKSAVPFPDSNRDAFGSHYTTARSSHGAIRRYVKLVSGGGFCRIAKSSRGFFI